MNERERQARFEALRLAGCLCCRLAGPLLRTAMRVEIHHLNEGGLHGGKRRGDEFTIPLCEWHHRGVLKTAMNRESMTRVYGPSWAGGSKPFRAHYASDDSLLSYANKLIAEAA